MLSRVPRLLHAARRSLLCPSRNARSSCRAPPSQAAGPLLRRTLCVEHGGKIASPQVIRKVTLSSAFAQFSDHWSPRVAGEVNDMHIKLAKIQGDFIWHHHETEDELFLVTKGTLRMKIRDPAQEGKERVEVVREGEFIVIPAKVEHCPTCEDECEIILLEPKSTLNTGNLKDSDRAVKELRKIEPV